MYTIRLNCFPDSQINIDFINPYCATGEMKCLETELCCSE